jgi:hypothetical protein
MLKGKSIKILLKSLLGLLLFLWMANSLYHQIRLQPGLKSTIHDILSGWDASRLGLLGLVLLFMGLNWGIEAIKWRLQLRDTERLSLGESIQSVLTGLAVSVITPNRIGEYMGRILYLKNVHKLQGITVTIIGSFAQLIVTGFLGLVGLIWYMSRIEHSPWLWVLLGSSILLCTVLTYLYFHLDRLLDWVGHIQVLRRIRIYLEIVRRFDRAILHRILLLSLGRYVVYTVQFLLLLNLMLVTGPWVDMMFTVWLIFWAMAIVPTIAIAEIGIRGETALFFLGPVCGNPFGIVTASLLLWLINLIIPALLGCLFVFRMKIYDDD